VCWLRILPWNPLFWVLAMLVVQSSCFAICFPSHIFHSNYLRISLHLCWIRGTCQIQLLVVYSFIVRSIFRWWRTRYIVCGKIISWLAHQWPFRCMDWSQTIMGRVNPTLREVKSHQVIALYSWILGDIIDNETRVSSRQMISFCR